MLKKTFAKRRVRSQVDLDDLPSFPAVVANALRRLRDPDASLGEVGDALVQDPRVSAQLLRLANSTAFALRHAVRSVPHAVSLLGRGTTESLLLGGVVSGVSGALGDRKQLVDFWTRAAQRALVARAVAQDVAIGQESECFTEGLLQDMAVPYLRRTLEVYPAMLASWEEEGGDFGALERDRLGYDHAMVAGWMAERWEFPDTLVAALSTHHERTDTPGGFAAATDTFEEEAFMEIAQRTFSADREQAERWFSARDGAEEFASLLLAAA